MSRDRAIVILPGEGRELALGPSLQLQFEADEAESDGSYSLSVATAGPEHPGTTPHVHRGHDDISFVIEGTLAFGVGEETVARFWVGGT